MRTIISWQRRQRARFLAGIGLSLVSASTFALSACIIDDGSGSIGDDYGDKYDDNIGDIDQTHDEVVYGIDNRTDVFDHGDVILQDRAIDSTVALMNPGDFDDSNPNDVHFLGQSLGQRLNLCTSERFRDDPTAAFCSGTLIDDDLVLTAGHCITSSSACNNTRFVFNYFRDGANSLQTVTTDDIFACTSIVARRQGVSGGQNLDYAVVRIDRPATPRFAPAPVRVDNLPMSVGQPVAVIGSGSGVPFKIDDGGSVRESRSGTLDFFVATTDTFGGNSGSGVYELDGYTVAGILVRGETDYVSNGSCTVVNECSETGCGGEDITYVFPAIEHYCSVATSDRLCGALPPPPPPPEDSFDYQARDTSSAQQNTVNQTVVLNDGDTLEFGTCGIAGSSFTGDTFLRLFRNGVQVASNDDNCGGLGSNITFTVPAGQGGAYEMRAGCFSNGECNGRVVFAITPDGGGGGGENGAFDFSASNTSSATRNTVNENITVSAGQSVRFGTCNVAGAAGNGDTFLRLFFNGTEVASNDDSAGCGLLSFAEHTAAQSGTYQIRAGCFSSRTCSGTVAYVIE